MKILALNFLSLIYQIITEIRNFLYKYQIIKSVKITQFVISIGNLSYGGTGKTPMTILIAEILIKQGYKVGIISSGYKRISKNEILVCDGKNLLCSVEVAGDELFMMARRLNIPTLADKQKYKAAQKLSELFPSLQIILVDDGYQHRKLHRDLDLLLIDKRTIEQNKIIPSGVLREAFSNYKRADLIGLRDVSMNEFQILNHDSNDILFEYNLKVSNLKSFNNQTKKAINFDTRILILSAIAQPNIFKDSIEKLGFTFTIDLVYKDHHNYSSDDIYDIINKCNSFLCKTIITTEKDFVKLETFESRFVKAGINLLYLPVDIAIHNGANHINKVLSDKLTKHFK